MEVMVSLPSVSARVRERLGFVAPASSAMVTPPLIEGASARAATVTGTERVVVSGAASPSFVVTSKVRVKSASACSAVVTVSVDTAARIAASSMPKMV